MRTRCLSFVVAVAALSPAFANAQGADTSSPRVDSATKRASGNSSLSKPVSPSIPLRTLRGELALVLSAAPFGPSTTIMEPGTTVREGGVEVEARPMQLAIEHDGKDYRIYMTRKTKLDNELRSGIFTSGVTYRVIGTVRDNVIFATEIVKE